MRHKMKTELTAQEAIEKVKNEKTIFLGIQVNKNNYPWDIRGSLQKMAEKGQISPREYKKALDTTFAGMTSSDKEIEATND
jgi:hypothetical protein